MPEIEELKNKIDLTSDLHKLVTTMKTLAAVGIREYENRVQSVNEFYSTVEMGLQVLLKIVPHISANSHSTGEEGVTALVVFGSDQGLCGAFNEHVSTFIMEALKQKQIEPKGLAVLAVGSRVAPHLEEAGCDVQECLLLPATPKGFSPLVNEIIQWMSRAQEQSAMNHCLLFHHRPVSSATFTPVKQQLLPFDMEWIEDLPQRPWPNRCLPMFTMDKKVLFSALVRNYLSSTLYRALAESLMSENMGRLAAMQLAEKNIEEHLDELKIQYQDRRQTQVTEELLDIVGGFEAIETADKKKRTNSD